MTSLDDDLQRWRQAGLIDGETARRIAAYEEGRTQPGSRPGFQEVLVYLGLAVLGVGVFVLTGVNWDELEAPARVGVAGVPAVLAVLAGFALRSTGSDELKRGAGIAWLLAVVLVGITVGVATAEADWNEENVALAAASASALVAVALWTIAPAHPQVVALVGSLGAVAVALGSRADDDQAAFVGLFASVLAAAVILLAEPGLLMPRSSGRALAGLLLAAGAFVAGVGSDPPLWAESLVFIAAAALIGLSLVRGVFVYLVMGVVALFLGLITAIIRHVDDPTLAALALIVAGGALVGAVLLLARLRRRGAVA